jgi:hypothetical protein
MLANGYLVSSRDFENRMTAKCSALVIIQNYLAGQKRPYEAIEIPQKPPRTEADDYPEIWTSPKR